MAPFVLLLAAMAAQENTEVRDLLRRVGESDSRASFRALAELVDGDEGRLAEVREGAGDLPEFFRDALRSELKLRREMGDHFGKSIRVEVGPEEKTAAEHLEDLKERSGMRLLPGHGLRQNSGDPFSLSTGMRSPMEVLTEICGKCDQTPHVYAVSTITLAPGGFEVEPWRYRNFAAWLGTVSLTRRMQFSGPSGWKAQIWFTAMSDPGVRMAAWKPQMRLIEAVTDGGVRLEEAEHAVRSAIRTEAAPGKSRRQSFRDRGFSVVLKLPDKTPERIARIRGVATALVAKRVVTFRLESGSKEDESFHVEVVDPVAGSRYQPESVLRVRPKKMKPGELLDRPVRIHVKYKGLGEGQTWVESRLLEEGVEYRVRWWSYANRFGRDHPKLEYAEVSIPMDFIDRPVYFEMRDIPLK